MFSWTDLFLFALAATWTPGPNPIASMGNVSAFGLRKTVPFWLGIYPAFFLLMTAAAFLSRGLQQVLPGVEQFLMLLGGGYMIYLGIGMLKRNPEEKDFETKKMGFKEGFLLQFMNPKVLFYCLTAMTVYVLPYFSGTAQLLGMSFLLVSFAMAGNLVWGIAGKLLQSSYLKHYKIINGVLALLLFYFAGKLILDLFA